jgi:hypothetical protein
LPVDQRAAFLGVQGKPQGNRVQSGCRTLFISLSFLARLELQLELDATAGSVRLLKRVEGGAPNEEGGCNQLSVLLRQAGFSTRRIAQKLTDDSGTPFQTQVQVVQIATRLTRIALDNCTPKPEPPRLLRRLLRLRMEPT